MFVRNWRLTRAHRCPPRHLWGRCCRWLAPPLMLHRGVILHHDVPPIIAAITLAVTPTHQGACAAVAVRFFCQEFFPRKRLALFAPFVSNHFRDAFLRDKIFTKTTESALVASPPLLQLPAGPPYPPPPPGSFPLCSPLPSGVPVMAPAAGSQPAETCNARTDRPATPLPPPSGTGIPLCRGIPIPRSESASPRCVGHRCLRDIRSMGPPPPPIYARIYKGRLPLSPRDVRQRVVAGGGPLRPEGHGPAVAWASRRRSRGVGGGRRGTDPSGPGLARQPPALGRPPGGPVRPSMPLPHAAVYSFVHSIRQRGSFLSLCDAPLGGSRLPRSRNFISFPQKEICGMYRKCFPSVYFPLVFHEF